MKPTGAILATLVILVLVSPAMAQDMPALTYDVTWTINSSYTPLGGGSTTTAHLTGSGELSYVRNPQEGAGAVTMSFGTPTNGGTFRFHQVGTAAGIHADDDFSFTTGLEALNPPVSVSCGRFPAQGACRVAEFTTPSNAFGTPSSFTLSAQYGFNCLSLSGSGCNGASGWSSSLDGTATLHTASATAAEPGSLIVVAAGLLGARMLRRSTPHRTKVVSVAPR